MGDTNEKWPVIQKRTQYLLSNEGLAKEAHNPFREYLTRRRESLMAHAVLPKDQGGEGLSKDVAIIAVNDRIDTLKLDISTNIEKGYNRQTPIPVDKILNGGFEGGAGSIMSGAPIQGFLDGMSGAVKSFVMGLPMVTQVIYWAKSQFNSVLADVLPENMGKWFGLEKGMKALSWKEAGDMAVGREIGENIGSALTQYTGLDVAALKEDLKQGLTYGFPEAKKQDSPAPVPPPALAPTTTPPAAVPSVVNPPVPNGQPTHPAAPPGMSVPTQPSLPPKPNQPGVLETPHR